MARMTLLKVVQAVLNDMDSDAVNSISDTEEGLQVASIARDVFYAFIDEFNVPSNKKLFQLDPNVSGKPNYMKLPTEVKYMEWLKYDCTIDNGTTKVYNEIRYLCPSDFIQQIIHRNTSDPSITVVEDTDAAVSLPIYNDRFPLYYTSFNELDIVFDAYNIDIDTELQQSKTMAYGECETTWTESDTFNIPLPDHLQTLYLNEVKSHCFVTMKQMENGKVEQTAQRLRATFQHHKHRLDGAPQRPNYGRR